MSRAGQRDLVALATGAGFVAIGLVWLSLRHWTSRSQAASPLGRFEHVEGRWIGDLEQPLFKGTMLATLKVIDGQISGDAVLHYGTDKKKGRLRLYLNQDKILYGRFLQLDYREDRYWKMVQFGAIVLEMTDDSARLRGRYVGYGRISQEIVGGSLILTRVGAPKETVHESS